MPWVPTVILNDGAHAVRWQMQGFFLPTPQALLQLSSQDQFSTSTAISPGPSQQVSSLDWKPTKGRSHAIFFIFILIKKKFGCPESLSEFAVHRLYSAWTQQLGHMLSCPQHVGSQNLNHCIGRQILNQWTTREVPQAMLLLSVSSVLRTQCKQPRHIAS